MIVLISDIHFQDGTAGDHNLSADAFELFFDRVQQHVKRHNVEKVDVVLLGDVFDVLRSSYWLDVDDVSGTPWGSPHLNAKALERHVGTVLEGILGRNATAIDTFLNRVESLRKTHGIDIGIVYVPGNHDRLVNSLDTPREMVASRLGIPAEDWFNTVYENREHGVVAAHGHQFDPFNSERLGSLEPEHHDTVPIGDPITTVLITQIPQLVEKEALSAGVGGPKLENLVRNFRNLENVRPLSAVGDWLMDQVGQHPGLEKSIAGAIRQAIEHFNDLSFVEDWYDRHDRYFQFDEADKIQITLSAMKLFTPNLAGRILGLAEALGRKDRYADGASFLLNKYDWARLCVLGHTHSPRQCSLSLTKTASRSHRMKTYLNTGTWRPRHHKCWDGSGFADWKEMTYVVVYKPQEWKHTRKGETHPSTTPKFETWTGTLEK
jgi:UDP-2,3-diacylglucosamine pyrophosphatase LpxH